MRRILPALLICAAFGSQLVSAPAEAKSAPAVAGRKVEVSSPLYEFSYAYPAAAGSIPALRALLDADIARQKRDLAASAASGRKEARANGYPFNPYGYWVDWQVVTDLPGWLSLSTEVSTFEGGAHPNHVSDTILWDKRANRRRDPLALFISKQALSRALRTAFCADLDKQRAERRGEPVKRGSSDPFSECIDPVENTVILGSSNRRSFDRIGVLVAPYNAGPYAEGAYEVTLPVTASVLALVRPEYRASFAIRP